MTLFSKPRYSTVSVKKKEIPKGLWTKCPESGEIVYNKELEQNLMVVAKSGYHFPLSAPDRIASLVDKGSFKEKDAKLHSVDALHFKAEATYTEKLKAHQKRTNLVDTVISGLGSIDGIPLALAVMDFRFLGGSMGSVAGEKITRTFERALKHRCPAIVVSTSGGARMYEGILSLMQLAKTSAAVARLKQAGLPYISVLTNPTTAGVMASYASLGDVIIAEPGALIGFAGPRVIKETTHQDLPEGFQTAEFLLKHGLIDQVVPRCELRNRLISLCNLFYTPAKQKKSKKRKAS